MEKLLCLLLVIFTQQKLLHHKCQWNLHTILFHEMHLKNPNKALDDVIFVLMPSINPDGTTMIVNWYNKYLNTEYDGAQMPYLYHIYSGHDNNRDWFMFNLKETQNVVKVAFHDMMPQIWLDEHQMGSTGARLFVVPYKDPLNPNVNPLIWRWQSIFGGMSALDLQKQGKTGVITQALFEGWWERSSKRLRIMAQSNCNAFRDGKL